MSLLLTLRPRLSWLVLVVVMGVFSRPARAADAVPAELQAALLVKLVAYDRTLTGKPLEILIVAVDADKAQAEKLRRAFAQFKVTTSIATPDEALSGFGKANLLYMFRRGSPELLEACAKTSTLTVTGTAEVIESGGASVGILTQAGKPQIVVNQNRLRTDGHSLAAALLKLARVIGQ